VLKTNSPNVHYIYALRDWCGGVGLPVVYEMSSEMKPVRHYYAATDAQVNAALSASVKQQH